MSRSDIDSMLIAIVDRCRGGPVPATDLNECASLVASAEPLIALENLCTQLFEYDSRIAPELLTDIIVLGQALGMRDKYWVRLSRPTA